MRMFHKARIYVWIEKAENESEKNKVWECNVVITWGPGRRFSLREPVSEGRRGNSRAVVLDPSETGPCPPHNQVPAYNRSQNVSNSQENPFLLFFSFGHSSQVQKRTMENEVFSLSLYVSLSLPASVCLPPLSRSNFILPSPALWSCRPMEGSLSLYVSLSLSLSVFLPSQLSSVISLVVVCPAWLSSPNPSVSSPSFLGKLEPLPPIQSASVRLF